MSETVMRAKVRVNKVEIDDYAERVTMNPIGRSTPYPEDGSDENNSYSRWTPDGSIVLLISNPNLHGKIRPGQEYYVDFTLAQARGENDPQG